MEITGYEGIYYIEPNGDVYSQDRIVEYKDGISYFKEGQLLKQWTMKRGYHFVTLCKNGNQKNYLVHRLLALTYIPNPNNYPCVNHKDCNKQNNNLENLEWCTNDYNIAAVNRSNFGGICFTYNRYRAQYHINKVTYSKRFKTKEEAKDWLNSQKLEIQKNNLINN